MTTQAELLARIECLERHVIMLVAQAERHETVIRVLKWIVGAVAMLATGAGGLIAALK